MSKLKIIAGSLIILALVAGVSVAFAQSVEGTPNEETGFPPFPNIPWKFGQGADAIDKQGLLADALGITVEELQSAYQTARNMGIERALDAGLITAEQAERLQLWSGLAPHGRRGQGRFFGQPLLADALGISVEQLQAAQETARASGLEQAVEEGLISPEEAELVEAKQALHEYIDKTALFAEALGISVEDLGEASAEGTSLPELIDELGLTPADIREGMEAARQAAIQRAVEDGVISQDLADQILENSARGFGPHGFGRGGSRHGRGGFGPGLFSRPDSANGEDGARFNPPVPGGDEI